MSLLDTLMPKWSYTDYMNSNEWVWRRYERMKGVRRCEICGYPTLYLQCHHRSYENLFNERDKDLQVICGGCHMMRHGIKFTKKMKKRRKDRVMRIFCNTCGMGFPNKKKLRKHRRTHG